MDKMHHLSAMDSAFLHLETAEMPMHVGSMHRYQLPEGYQGSWYDDVREHLAKRLHLAPVFTRKLALMPFDLANPVWIEDDDIDLDYHIRRTVLPKPGTQEQLEALAARLHSSLLDRSRPLWEFYVIEGLADGTMGFYTKVHHAAIDGQAGVALGNAMLDITPVPRSVKPRAQRRQNLRPSMQRDQTGAAVGQQELVGRRQGAKVLHQYPARNGWKPPRRRPVSRIIRSRPRLPTSSATGSRLGFFVRWKIFSQDPHSAQVSALTEASCVSAER